MKTFNPNATKLIISFVEESKKTKVEFTIDEIPIANMEADNASDSETSNDVSFTPFEGADTYNAVLYVNMYEGNIELYNDDKNVEIEDFEIQETFEEEDNE